MLSYEEMVNMVNERQDQHIKIRTVMMIVQTSFWHTKKYEEVYQYLWDRHGHPSGGSGEWGKGTENELELDMMWLFGNPSVEEWKGPDEFIDLKEVKANIDSLYMDVAMQIGIDRDITLLFLQWARHVITECWFIVNRIFPKIGPSATDQSH